jgi:hypothetical protein
LVSEYETIRSPRSIGEGVKRVRIRKSDKRLAPELSVAKGN